MKNTEPLVVDSPESALTQLQNVVDTLIGPNGCAWDKEQTPQSLADYVIEESHELMDAMSVCPWNKEPTLEHATQALAGKSQQVVSAIRFGEAKDVCEELGDVAFLLLFIAKLYEKQGAFSLETALQMGAEKMIRRHPHVFGETKFENLEAQLKEWERIKRQEKGDGDGHDKGQSKKPAGIFDSLPQTLPPLIKAYRIHSKAARVNFTWPEEQDVEQQMEAEWLEWLDVAQGEDKDAQTHELGDMLFTLVELGRRKGIKASEALDLGTTRFLQRFAHMEALAHERGLNFAELSLDDKDDLWNEIKEQQKAANK